MINKERGLFKFLSGAILGIVAGVVAGLLLAEKPGRELRRDIEMSSSELAHGLKEKIEELKDSAANKISDFRGFAGDKFKASAINIQNKAADLGKQLEELTAKK